jgi:hypothetical protein
MAVTAPKKGSTMFRLRTALLGCCPILLEANAGGGGGAGGGQGDSGNTGGLFDSYLQSVPEDGRETVAAYLKDAQTNVNGRLEEAAQLKENWGDYDQHLAPFRETYKPEELAQILSWYNQLSTDEEAYKAFVSDAAKQVGLLGDGSGGGVDEPPGDLTREEVMQLLEQQQQGLISQAVGPLQERLAAFEQDQMVGQIESQSNAALEALEGERGVQLTKEQRALVLELGAASPESENPDPLNPDWVKAGFERFQAITTAGQQAFVERAQQQPNAPMTTGATAAAKRPTTTEEAHRMAVERLRAVNAT